MVYATLIVNILKCSISSSPTLTCFSCYNHINFRAKQSRLLSYSSRANNNPIEIICIFMELLNSVFCIFRGFECNVPESFVFPLLVEVILILHKRSMHYDWHEAFLTLDHTFQSFQLTNDEQVHYYIY